MNHDSDDGSADEGSDENLLDRHTFRLTHEGYGYITEK